MAIPPNNTADARSSNQAAKGNGAVAKGNAGDKPRSTPSATKQPLVTLATIMPWLDPHAGWVDAPLPVRPAWGIPKSTTAGSEQPVRRVSLESPTPTHEGDASEKLQSPKQHLHASEPDTCVQLTDVERKLEALPTIVSKKSKDATAAAGDISEVIDRGSDAAAPFGEEHGHSAGSAQTCLPLARQTSSPGLGKNADAHFVAQSAETELSDLRQLTAQLAQRNEQLGKRANELAKRLQRLAQKKSSQKAMRNQRIWKKAVLGRARNIVKHGLAKCDMRAQTLCTREDDLLKRQQIVLDREMALDKREKSLEDVQRLKERIVLAAKRIHELLRTLPRGLAIQAGQWLDDITTELEDGDDGMSGGAVLETTESMEGGGLFVEDTEASISTYDLQDTDCGDQGRFELDLDEDNNINVSESFGEDQFAEQNRGTHRTRAQPVRKHEYRGVEPDLRRELVELLEEVSRNEDHAQKGFQRIEVLRMKLMEGNEDCGYAERFEMDVGEMEATEDMKATEAKKEWEARKALEALEDIDVMDSMEKSSKLVQELDDQNEAASGPSFFLKATSQKEEDKPSDNQEDDGDVIPRQGSATTDTFDDDPPTIWVEDFFDYNLLSDEEYHAIERVSEYTGCGPTIARGLLSCTDWNVRVALGPIHVHRPEARSDGDNSPRIVEASLAMANRLLCDQRRMVRFFMEATLQDKWDAVGMLIKSGWDLALALDKFSIAHQDEVAAEFEDDVAVEFEDEVAVEFEDDDCDGGAVLTESDDEEGRDGRRGRAVAALATDLVGGKGPENG
ncbi:hypothetical protein DL546_001547 [Coniochaeta pulveracea]|uniref:Uncharacterized protein n=1 Tax=Coniochaeta pulveracea TaxID=177199 RepID=A0A420Y288_9PEZI|nr:hypothetical protein DL546_001547 [Coniochaeta pulveracea]